MKAKNFDELQKLQDKLRAERNKLTDEYRDKNNKLQEQIDALDLQKYNADKYLNKFIAVQVGDMQIYMRVTAIDRLFGGARYIGNTINISSNCINICNEYSITLKYEKLADITEISKEDYISVINNFVNNHINNIEDGNKDV